MRGDSVACDKAQLSVVSVGRENIICIVCKSLGTPGQEEKEMK